MTQEQRRIWLIRELLKEQKEYAGVEIPAQEQEQKRLLRSLWQVQRIQSQPNIAAAVIRIFVI